MASILDFFSPGPMAGVAPDPQAQNAVGTFMSDPKTLSALLAFGTQAMVPQWGGGAVQFAKGVGNAGETLDRQEEATRRQQETDSKSELRASQATAAEARAGAAGARADSSAQRLALETFKQGEISKRNELGRRVALSGMYQKYIADVQKRNGDPLRPAGQPPEQVLPMQQWIQSNPMLKNLGLVPPNPGDTGQGAEGDALPAEATSDTGSMPPAPRDREQRQVGMTYSTPKGPLKWNGQIWVTP
jgi:hypothetical protein